MPSARSVLSTTTAVEAAFRYKPFGEPATPLVTSSTDPRFKYASQDLSQATNLVHMGARYYAPDLGRFTSRDPVGSHGYAYARDDPMVYWDPSGLDSQGFDWAGFGAFLAGAAVMGACIALTAGVCGGLLVAVALSAAAGALVATAITLAQGQPITLAAVAGGALMGAFGGGFVFGFAGAGAFGEAAAQSALGVSASLSAGEGLGAGVAGAVGEEEGAAEDLGADVPAVAPPAEPPNGLPPAWDTTPGTPEDVAQTEYRLELARDRALSRYELTPEQAADVDRAAAHAGTQIHAEFDQAIQEDEFLRARVTYNTKGVDVEYNYGPQEWELTTPGSVAAHDLRFIAQGYDLSQIEYLTYVLPGV